LRSKEEQISSLKVEKRSFEEKKGEALLEKNGLRDTGSFPREEG